MSFCIYEQSNIFSELILYNMFSSIKLMGAFHFIKFVKIFGLSSAKCWETLGEVLSQLLLEDQP